MRALPPKLSLQQPHIIMNQSGNMVSTVLSNRHTADIKIVEQLIMRLKAKLYADRGYIAQNLKQNFKMQPIELIIHHRKKCRQ